MTVKEKIKAVDNKLSQNKAQCNLDRQRTKILALSSGNVGKYKFVTGEDISPEKILFRNTIKGFVR